MQLTPDAKPMPTGDSAARRHVPEWRLARMNGAMHLQRAFRFASYDAALAFAVRLRELAGGQANRLRVIIEQDSLIAGWRTVDEAQPTLSDYQLAATIDDLYMRWPEVSGQKDRVQEASEESFPASDPPAY